MRKFFTPLQLLFYSSIIVSFITLGLVIYDRAILPPNVCPITNRTPLIFLSITLLLIYFATSTSIDIYKKLKK